MERYIIRGEVAHHIWLFRALESKVVLCINIIMYMTNMMKNKIAIAVSGIVAVSALAVSIAGAETTATTSTVVTATPSVKMAVQINASGKTILDGLIASITANAITVNSWGGAWTINIGSDTKLIRRFGGNSTTSEFVVGDIVSVNGTASKDAAWTINAKIVKNMSIQARNASFSGTISNLRGNTFTLATRERKTVNVTMNADVKVRAGNRAKTTAALANGATVLVSGVWDRTQATVMAAKVTITRMPKVVTPTVVPTATSTTNY